MGQKFTVNGHEIDVDDDDAIRALSKHDFADLLRQTFEASPDEDASIPEPDEHAVQHPAGTAFIMFPHTPRPVTQGDE